MSLNAKYRGKKPKKYFENKYADPSHNDRRGFKNSQHYILPKGDIAETFLSYFENSEKIPEAYYYDPTYDPNLPSHLWRFLNADTTHFQKELEVKNWWTSLNTESDLQVQLQKHHLNTGASIESLDVAPSYEINSIDTYINEGIDFKALKESGHIQKMLRNKNLKQAIEDIPHEVLLWVCMLMPFWAHSPHDLPENTSAKALLTHLLCKYKVADCLLFNLLHSETFCFKHFITFFILGQGGSIYQLGPKFNLEFPKRFAEFMNELPEKTSNTHLFMYACVRNLGGSLQDFNRLKSNEFFVYPSNFEMPVSKFKITTFQWIIKHRDAISNEQCEMILEWASHIYTEGYHANNIDTFWKRRGVANTLQRSRTYKQQLREQVNNCHWESKQWDWQYKTNKGDLIRMTELLSTYELYQEGEKMKHCIRMYWQRCNLRKSAVFSLMINARRCLTIEIDPIQKKIRQARGLQNSTASLEENDILQKWLKEVVNQRE